MHRRGFSLVEVLIVIGVTVLIAAASVPKFVEFYNKYSLDTSTADLVSALRLAQMRSMTGEKDSRWSVHIVTGAGGSFTLYKGATFASRETDYDDVVTLPSALSLASTVSGTEITFARSEGSTSNTGTLTISWSGGGLSKGASINALGTIDPF